MFKKRRRDEELPMALGFGHGEPGGDSVPYIIMNVKYFINDLFHIVVDF